MLDVACLLQILFTTHTIYYTYYLLHILFTTTQMNGAGGAARRVTFILEVYYTYYVLHILFTTTQMNGAGGAAPPALSICVV